MRKWLLILVLLLALLTSPSLASKSKKKNKNSPKRHKTDPNEDSVGSKDNVFARRTDPPRLVPSLPRKPSKSPTGKPSKSPVTPLTRSPLSRNPVLPPPVSSAPSVHDPYADAPVSAAPASGSDVPVSNFPTFPYPMTGLSTSDGPTTPTTPVGPETKNPLNGVPNVTAPIASGRTTSSPGMSVPGSDSPVSQTFFPQLVEPTCNVGSGGTFGEESGSLSVVKFAYEVETTPGVEKAEIADIIPQIENAILKSVLPELFAEPCSEGRRRRRLALGGISIRPSDSMLIGGKLV